MGSLGEKFPEMQRRTRELRDAYASIGPNGRFGLMVIDDILARAERAAISGDVVEMLRLYQEMQELK